MGRSENHEPESGPPSEPTARGAGARSRTPRGLGDGPEPRIADLESQLALAAQALQSQRATYDEDSASFEKALSRLAQSERSLSQTKARLVDAETLARAERGRAEALAVDLEAIKTTAAAELASAKERASAAEAREQQALATARAARFEQAANAAELEEAQGKVSDLQAQNAELGVRHTALIAQQALCDVQLIEAMALIANLKTDLADCQVELAAANERNSLLTHERTRLSGLLGSLEVLAREITQLTGQAAIDGASLPKVEGWIGRDVEAEHIRVTLRPEGMAAPAPKAPRTESAPEITVDGVKLES
jgi:chromosome segregation ATPase